MGAVIGMFVAIALVATVVAVLDYLARRKERRSDNHPAA